MADRYWVGGTGSWNSTTKWSATSGGASGASVPTASDNVIFDANSGTAHYTVTITTLATCANFTFTPVPFDGVTQFARAHSTVASTISTFVITGTFSTTGTQGNRRAWFRSSDDGVMRDIEIANIGTVADVDFRDIRITGAGGTFTGTRIGDLAGNSNITFSAPKNCYRISNGTGGLWSNDQWSGTSGGLPNTDFFPLAQDTAVFDQNTASGTYSMNTSIPYTGTVDSSARTSSFTLSLPSTFSIYGNLINGSGVTFSSTSQSLVFRGRKTQVLNANGRTIPQNITIYSFGGKVELASALNMSTRIINVQAGTFDTKGFALTIGGVNSLLSGQSIPREIKLGASSVTCSLSDSTTASTSFNLSGNSSDGTLLPTNLTFDAGTSSITFTSSTVFLAGGGQNFYNLSFTNTGGGTVRIAGVNTINNMTIGSPGSFGLKDIQFYNNLTITGTLNASNAALTRRIMIRSSASGTARTLTVGTLFADQCDFKDITIAGAASGSSLSDAGDLGNNSGLTFPAPKVVYWNLAGSQTWASNGWATTSGGVPSANNFPLAQDTAVFDDNGSAGTITLGASNIGTLDASARTISMTLTGSVSLFVSGSWIFGSGLTSTYSGSVQFIGRGTNSITCAGKSFSNGAVVIDCFPGTVQLADAFTSSSSNINSLALVSGEFDAGIYNVSLAKFTATNRNIRTLKMGSGLWTLSGSSTGTWNLADSTNLVFYKGTADILLTSTSTGFRQFAGGGLSYNKLTLGGNTTTSTTTLTGTNYFTEIASTKTVAHTINFSSNTQQFGKWSVTGTAGNVVTLLGTSTANIISGPCTDGIDYLAMGSIGFSANSGGEFYAGVNSTGTAGAPVYRTAKPADSTRYWVGGTGLWNDTNRWSTSSGGAGGASLPRSHDNVVFDSNSNATLYTVTVNAITGGNRCKALTITGPASGVVTILGSTTLFIHGDITMPTTGLAFSSYNGTLQLRGPGVGNTITSNGNNLSCRFVVDGGGNWSLADALNTSNTFACYYGSFNTSNFNLSCGFLSADAQRDARSIILGSSIVNVSNLDFGTSENVRANLTFDSGTSQITCTSTSGTFEGNNQTFNDVIIYISHTIRGINTFNNLTFLPQTTDGLHLLTIDNDQIINGTLTFSPSLRPTIRCRVVKSSLLVEQSTLNCAAISSLIDIDFQDIIISGPPAPVSGTRLGDCGGNSGITFVAGSNKYWNLPAGGDWNSIAWATSSGGAVSLDNFPLAQDTCLFESSGLNSGATVTISSGYSIGTIDMSARTTNTMTLSATADISIYGDWINGTGVTLSGTNDLEFTGVGTHTITSAGKTFTQDILVLRSNGTVIIQDALSCGQVYPFLGAFDANDYNVTCNGVLLYLTTAFNVGSGTWTISGGSAWYTIGNCQVTGTGTININNSYSSTTNVTFFGAGLDYSGITLNNAGTGTLTIFGDNTFANISNTGTVPQAINFGNSTQRVADFTATGTLGNVLKIFGATGTGSCDLIYTGQGQATYENTDYLELSFVRGYPMTNTWYAGNNSINNGSTNWNFTTPPVVVPSTGNFLMLFG